MSELPKSPPEPSPPPPVDGTPPPRKLELAEEIAVYKERLPELLEHEGEFVLIKHKDIIGFYPDRGWARREGYQRFGMVPFLVKQIRQFEPVYYIPGVVP